jgi:hypothetical protein
MKFRYFKKGPALLASKFTFWEWHHFWSGLVVVIGGFWGIFHASLAVAIPLLVLGAWIALDDVFQHFRQRFEIEMTKTEYYPGHYTCRSFWHWCWYRKYWNI